MKAKKQVWMVVIVAALFSLSYAIVRYNVFGQVPWKDLPFYVMNKAVSLTTIILFTIGYSADKQSNKKSNIKKKWQYNKRITEITSSLLIIHVLMSLMLFKPEIYAKFFAANGTISLLGGLSMVAGIISFVFIWSNKLYSLSNKKNYKPLISLPWIVNGAVLFILIHLFFMGYEGWITPGKWNGGMPPISLIAFLIGSSGLLIKIYRNFVKSTSVQNRKR